MQTVIAAPINDQQLVALMACHWPELTAEEAVGRATDVLSEVILRCGPENDEVGRKVKEKKPGFLEERQAAMLAQQNQGKLLIPGGPVPGLSRIRQ